jgi:hypothetical protein
MKFTHVYLKIEPNIRNQCWIKIDKNFGGFKVDRILRYFVNMFTDIFEEIIRHCLKQYMES